MIKKLLSFNTVTGAIAIVIHAIIQNLLAVVRAKFFAIFMGLIGAAENIKTQFAWIIIQFAVTSVVVG